MIRVKMIFLELQQAFKLLKVDSSNITKTILNNNLGKDKSNESQNDMKKIYIYDTYNNDATYEK